MINLIILLKQNVMKYLKIENIGLLDIRLNQDFENSSDSDLIVALIEENEHYKTGFEDETRAFQTHFIKLYSNLLLKDVKVLL